MIRAKTNTNDFGPFNKRLPVGFGPTPVQRVIVRVLLEEDVVEAVYEPVCYSPCQLAVVPDRESRDTGKRTTRMQVFADMVRLQLPGVW